MTRKQNNNQYSGGITAQPRLKKFRVQKSAGKFLTSIFWGQDRILLIDYLPNGQTINAKYYSSLLVQLKDVLRKNAAGSSPRESCSCTTMPRLTGHLQPRRNWPTWASSHPPYSPDLAPSDYNWEVAIFRPTRRSLLPRRSGWTDSLLIFFFCDLQKLEQRAKKCIELCGEHVKEIPSLFAVACFLPGRAKDLSAPRSNRPSATAQARPVKHASRRASWCGVPNFWYVMMLYCHSLHFIAYKSWIRQN